MAKPKTLHPHLQKKLRKGVSREQIYLLLNKHGIFLKSHRGFVPCAAQHCQPELFKFSDADQTVAKLLSQLSDQYASHKKSTCAARVSKSLHPLHVLKEMW